MEEVTKKEIRVPFYLDNENDKELFEELKAQKQPGRVIKEKLQELKELKNKNTISTDISLEALKLIDKLTDKIDNLNIGVVQLATTEEPKEEIKEIELNGEVNAEDIDIDY